MKSKEALLMIRQNIIAVFKRYEIVILPILRFVLSFMAIQMLKEVTSYVGILSSPLAMVAIALIGAFASAQCIELCGMLLIVWFTLAMNPVLAIVLFMMLMIFYILYGRLFPCESILVVVTLIAFSIKLEVFLPIIVGLVGSYVSIVAIMIGMIIWFIMPEFMASFPSTGISKDEIIATIMQLIEFDYKGVFHNQTMMVMMIVFFVVFTVIYIIRKLAIDYGGYIAIAIGVAMNMIGFGIGIVFFMDLDINFVWVMVETVLAGLLAICMQFFAIVLDYQRAETVNFEDEDNYYYVKIVPKIKVDFKENRVKKVYTDLTQTNNYKKMFMEDDNFNSHS